MIDENNPKPARKRVFVFAESSLVERLKTSDFSDQEQTKIYQFLTSEHCYDDLFYYTGDHLKEIQENQK